MKRTKSKLLKSHKIEKRVFTRWINHKLKHHDKFIRDIQFDLCSGEILVELIEILSKKKLETITFSNQDRQSRICTLNSVLIFLRLEGMALENIEPSDILDGSLKKIKELLWILICHYSIKTLLGENNFEQIGKSFLKWLNSKLDGYFIDNLTSAWNSGIAIGIIVNSCDRDLCTDVLKWNSNNALDNARFAMEAAFQCFMIPQLLKPYEIIDTCASEKAIMTYVSQFSGLLKEKNNNKYELTGKCMSSAIDDGGNTSMMMAAISTDNLSQCQLDYNIRVLGKPDTITNQRIDLLITIPITEREIVKNLIVEAVDKNGNVYKCRRNRNYSKSNELSFSLIPILSGNLDIFIKKDENAKEILNKPFRLCVNLPNTKQTVVSYGPGLHGSVVDVPGIFILDTNGSDQQIGFSMEGPSKTKIECVNFGNGSVMITYCALLPGIYQLSIMANEESICDSPYSITITKSENVEEIKKVKVIGLETKNTKSFIIDSRNTIFEMPPDVECFDKFGVCLNNILVTELERKYYQIECPLNSVDRLIVFVGYFMVQIEGFPYAIDYLDSDDDQKKANKYSSFSNLQEKCLEILKQDLVDAIELSVQDLCVDTINDALINTRSRNINIRPETSEDSMVMFETYKWMDKRFGLILYGTSLCGKPIKKGEYQVVQIDLNQSIQEGSLGFALEGPIETLVQCFSKEDGQYIIKFQPMVTGKYELSVTIDENHIEGSPFIIIVSDTDDAPVTTPISPIHNSDQLTVINQCLSTNSMKIGNTPTNCDVSSLSSTILSKKGQVLKSFPTEYKSQQEVLEIKPVLIPNKKVNDECESIFSSNTSGNSIPSGVYKARIRKLSLLKNKDPIKRDNFCAYRSKSENDNDSSISSSTSMEIERLSQNYQESVLIFYENMLSAFTNLSVVDIIYYSIERITNIILSAPNQISSFNDVIFQNIFRNSFNSQFSTSSRELLLTFNEITSIKYDESQTLSQITTPVELKIQDSGKYNTISTSVDSLLNGFSEKSICKRPVKMLRSNLISSFEVLQDNINMIDETYQECSENNFHTLRSKCVESYYWDSSFCKSSNPITLTSNTEIAMEDYQKSIGVDIASSMSSNRINTEGDLAKYTNAEVVFDSSSVESRKTSNLISVYDKVLTKNAFPITEQSDYKESPSESIELSKVSVYNFKDVKNIANPLKPQSNKKNFQDLTFVKTSNKHFLGVSSKQYKLSLNYEKTETESLVSYDSIEIPLYIEGKVKKFKNNCLVVHKQLTETRKTESLINYLNVFQTNSKYFVEKPKIYYEEINENTMSTVSVSEKLPLLSTNYIRMIHFEEEATPFFVDENLKKHLVSVSCLEYSKTRNLANISMLLPNCHQFRCPNPYLLYKNSEIHEKQSETPKLENVIFQEMIQFYVSKYVKDYLRKKLNLKKRETFPKSTEKSAQTSSILLDGVSTRNLSEINPFNFKISANRQISEINIHRCESKEINSQDLLVSSNESQDISSAVETLVDAITDIAKNHLILYPSRSNVKRVEELLKLLPRLLEFGKEKRLYHINFLTDQLEAILLNSNDQSSNKALSQIIKSIKSCVYLGKSNSKSKFPIKEAHNKLADVKENRHKSEIFAMKTESEDLNQISYEVHVIGKALCKGFVNFDNKFVVHTSGKTPGNLAICIEGPSKAEINFMDKKIGIYIVSYKVTIPGEYICAISFNKIDIPHSPFRIIVTDDVNDKIYHRHFKDDLSNKVDVQNQGNSSSIKTIGRNLIFHVSSPEILNLNCFVTDPQGGSKFHQIKKMSKTSNKDGFINLFTTNSGFYNIDFYNFLGDKIGPSWKLKLEYIQGSLKSTLLSCNADMKSINSLTVDEIYQNICAYGDGLQKATINHKNYFFIFLWNYSERTICNEPSLDVTIDGPSKVQISCIEDINGYIFCYIPIVSGIYFIGIKYSNKCHIPGSPFKVVVLSDPNSDLNNEEFES